MKYNMHLINEAYNSIFFGTKRVEIRLLDEKRSKLKVNDVIIFTNLEYPDKSFEVLIKNLKTFNNIYEVLDNYDISLLLSMDTKKEELVNTFNNIYSKDEQNKYKVLCIEFKIKK